MAFTLLNLEERILREGVKRLRLRCTRSACTLNGVHPPPLNRGQEVRPFDPLSKLMSEVQRAATPSDEVSSDASEE